MLLLRLLAGSRDRYEPDRNRDGPRRDNDRFDGGRDRFRDRYDDRDRRDRFDDKDRRDLDRGGELFCLFRPMLDLQLNCYQLLRYFLRLESQLNMAG